MATGDQSVLQARIAGLSLENERLKQHYDRQINDLHRTSELMISEMRKTLEQEHKRAISELRQQNAIELMRAVEEAKRKQWCANCMREAQLYCCWNTSYCDYPCQQLHWPGHSATCGQSVPPTIPVPPSVPAPIIEPGRAKAKVATPTATPSITNPSPSSQIMRTVAACPSAPPSANASSSKKWPPMMTLMNQSNQEAMLKLPATTYLRPVVSTTMTAPVTAPQPANNNSTNVIMAPTPPPGNNLATIISAQRNPPNYNAKHPNPAMPVQRFNIPVS